MKAYGHSFHDMNISDLWYSFILRKDIKQFTTDLSIMLKAKLSLMTALQILMRQNKPGYFKQVLKRVIRDIENGTGFNDSLKQFPHLFNGFYLCLIETGESTGKLDEMLFRISRYQHKIDSLRRKIMQALSYPGLVIMFAFICLGFVFYYVIPVFSGIFKEFDTELPGITTIILNLSKFVTDYLIFLIVGWVLLAILFKKLWVVVAVRISMEKIFLSMPLTGRLVKHHLISQFCRTLGTLLESGIGLLNALLISRSSSPLLVLQMETDRIVEHIRNGNNMMLSFSASKLFPLMVVQMISIGEEVAELPLMLNTIASYFENEIDHSVEMISSFLEPVVILIIGVIIGIVLIAIYLPILNLSQVMG